MHFSCSVNHTKAHEGLWLGSQYLPGTNRLSVTSYIHTAGLHHSLSHSQQCMAVLLGLFTLSRRPSVRQRNEWLFILEGWFNELDPQLLCVSTRHIQTRLSPFLTPPYPLDMGGGHPDCVLRDGWVRTPCLFTKGIWQILCMYPSFNIPLTHRISPMVAKIGRGLPVYIHVWAGEQSGEDYWANMYTTWGLPPSRTYIQASNENHLCFHSYSTLCKRVWWKEREVAVISHLHQMTEKRSFWLCASGQTRTDRWRKGEEETRDLKKRTVERRGRERRKWKENRRNKRMGGD